MLQKLSIALLTWTFLYNEPGQLGLKSGGEFETSVSCNVAREKMWLKLALRHGYTGTWWISPGCEKQ